VVEGVRTLPGVREAQGVRMVESRYSGRAAVIEAIDHASHGLPLKDGPWTAVAEQFWEGQGVTVSDHLSHRTGLARGDRISLPAPSGEVHLTVLGIFSDFQSGDLGSIAMSRKLYRQTWGDHVVNTIRVWTDSPANTSAVRASIQRSFGQSHGLRVLTTAEFRAAVAELVENALSITYGLLLVALSVSFVGVANFLLATSIDRAPQRRILSTLGVSPAQLGGATILEGTLVGAVGALLGVVAGLVESRLIVQYCVPMVCGWHFDYHFPTMTAALLAAVALVLSGLAGLLSLRVATSRTAAIAWMRE
jgi:putative ABC transport system permease protein